MRIATLRCIDPPTETSHTHAAISTEGPTHACVVRTEFRHVVLLLETRHVLIFVDSRLVGLERASNPNTLARANLVQHAVVRTR